MAGRRATRDAITREQWAATIASAFGTKPTNPRPTRRGRPAISTERIVNAALEAIEADGYEDLTMRSVAAMLDTGPASLYAHIRNKAELGDLLIGELCSRVVVPVADESRWEEQFLDVCGQLRDQLMRYPGVARAALAVVPADPSPLRLSEGLLGILLAGGAKPREAAWASDAAFLYVTAYSLEAADSQRQEADLDGTTIDRHEIAERLRMLPAAEFPHTVAYAEELTSGDGHDRFVFTLRLLIRGLQSPL